MKPTESPENIREIAPGTLIDARYRVVRCIGQGGNGMVYEVEHARTGRKLALKALLDETGFARLEQEARAASMMKNGHTARIIDMEPGGPTGAYMVMELLEGQSLRGLLEDAGQLSLELTVNIAIQICECLQEAHALGIIHRDLKPENVFLCASPWPGQYDVKVLDFGVMKVSEDGGAIPKSSLTRTGSTVGTPYYMSLEQLRNSSAVDARADIYALGVVLYECLSGRKPFQAETIGDLVYALCSGPPPQLGRIRPDVPPEISELVMRTLSATREDRPASMSELALALVPHANPAFGLWLKVSGKQPALSQPRGPVSSSRSRVGVPSPPLPPPSVPHANAVAPPPVAPVADLPPARPGSSGMPGVSALSGRAPAGTIRFAGPVSPVGPVGPVTEPPPAPSGPSGRSASNDVAPPHERRQRDTPTAMFAVDVHDGMPKPISPDSPDDIEEPETTTGDRDTPTRAIDLAALVRAPQTDEDAGDAPTFNGKSSIDSGAIPMAPSPGQPAQVGLTTLPLDPYGAVPTEALSQAEIRVALAAVPKLDSAIAMSAGPAPSAGSVASGVPATASLDKPQWQVQMDQALVTVGGFVDEQVKRYQAAPHNVQRLVAIAGGLLALCLLGLMLLAKLH